MKAEIIAVGTEILLGDIVNTNAAFLSKELQNLGIFVYHQSVVGDNEERLLKEFKEAFLRSDMIITTGGLGPTQDDITKEVGAKFFHKELLLHEESLNRIEEYFKKSGRVVNEGNKKQAFMPEGSIILENNNGTAPGCIIEEGNKILIVLPGPPKEVSPMFFESVVPYLKKFQNGILKSRVLRILGIGEGHMAERINFIITESKNPTVAPYAKEGDVILRLTASCKTEEECLNLLDNKEKEIRNEIGEFIYGVDDTTIEEVVCNMLLQKGLTLSTAESCTGGLLSGKIINFPGASNIYKEGVITYSNDAKIEKLSVSKETLAKYGAVSSECAKEMAEGIAKASNTDVSISVTGIAGPGGGTLEKPVGLVYIGLYIKGKVMSRECHFNGNRNNVRIRAVNTALDYLRKELSR